MILAAAAQASDPAAITVQGRDYTGLDQFTQVVTGTCDGTPASATITKARRGASGKIELRHGSVARDLPSSFAEGLLVRNTAYQLGLGCDGKRLKLEAHVVQMNWGRNIRYFSQQATWDLGADSLVVSEPVAESPGEFAAHVQ
ncbi:MAG TPA: hypothetical protein VFQ67_10420 [Allosphingosinicella sp.]|jgi:hypothetical protein|nr:hypothetical protein [Allosphingosinicella sp.]